MELPQLIRAAQGGDVEAFGALVERFGRFAYAVAYAQLGDSHLAEDAAQEAFIDAYLHLSGLREPGAFVPWFRRIVFKHADRLTRGARPAAPIADLDLPSPGDVAGHAEDRELGRQLRRIVGELPEGQRLATALFYLAGYDVAEIAASLEISGGAVKKRLHDARQTMKERLSVMSEEFISVRPPQQLSLTVQFLITVRTRNLARVRELLARDPGLVHAREERDLAMPRRVYAPLSGGFTALHRAAGDGAAELAALLLQAGADVNARSNFGETPLHSAVSANHPEAAALLLSRGADPNAALPIGLTPLHWAVMRGYRPLIDALLAAGADPDRPDQHGRTPRDWARIKGFELVAR
ncbi:MAG TPA: sigma-70 family RNA polymerase sigma factor [Herpetosiphonaceae bacterium]|nr:sigma-70 family RNA polymerase sigma factor [Herpetosiphonaceae bacterium]